MLIRSYLIRPPKNNLISNSKQLFNAMDLLPITFGKSLPMNPLGKNSINSQHNPGTTDDYKNSKVCIIKTYYTNVTKFLKIKQINAQLWQGPLILHL